jgi:DnaJ domain
MSITAYPLAWPETMPRYKGIRESGQFKTTLVSALKNVENSLYLFGKNSGKPVTGVILSSNVSLGNSRPSDSGIAAWFTWEGAQMCIAVDRYQTPEANLQAIHLVLEARRVELRHGTLALVRATFQGFKALPPPKHWSEVLGVARSATRIEIEDAFKRLAMAHHPDRGGSSDVMAEFNAARARALEERP